jgi:hypothetical protein
MNGFVLAALLAAFPAAIYFLRPRHAKAPRTLPPGPKPLPVVGNIADLSMNELWLKAAAWAQEFGRLSFFSAMSTFSTLYQGSVTHLRVFSQSLVFLNTPASTAALLNEKGSIYSDKPNLVMVGSLCGCENMVAFTPYGEQSRRQRKLLNSALGVTTIPSYHNLISSNTSAFLRNLISKPAEFETWIKNYGGALTLSVIYGYEIKNARTDPFLKLADECVDLLANKIAGGGGLWLVDIFPSLQYFPEWLPGMGFMAKARTWKAKMEEFVEKPFVYLMDSMVGMTFFLVILSDTGSSQEIGQLRSIVLL